MAFPKTKRPGRAPDLVHSVFFRMIVSYVLLVFLVAVSIASVSYLFFQSQYNKELENLHHSALQSIEEELTGRIVDQSKTIYMEIAGQLNQPNSRLLRAEDSPGSDPTKVLQTFRFLQDEVARNYEIVEAIHLYFPGHRMVVSSTGMTLSESSGGRLDGESWRQTLIDHKRNAWWSELPFDAMTGISPPAGSSSCTGPSPFWTRPKRPRSSSPSISPPSCP